MPPPSPPQTLDAYSHPHPAKHTHKPYFDALMSTLAPEAAPLTHGFRLETLTRRRYLIFGPRSRITAPFSASADIEIHDPTSEGGGGVEKVTTWHIDSASTFARLAALCDEKGYMRARVCGVAGIECEVVLVREGAEVPEGVWKLRVWREPRLWVGEKWESVKALYRLGAEVRREEGEVGAEDGEGDEKDWENVDEEEEKEEEGGGSLCSEDEKKVECGV